MITVYVYVLDTLADWEIGLITSELNSKRFFRKDATEVLVKTVGSSKDAVKTMGGLTVVPDCVISDIIMDDKSVLILPGADTWNDAKNYDIIKTAVNLLDKGGTVGALCGATVALAKSGILDNRVHTSNGKGFLKMFCPKYKGTSFYVDSPAVTDKNLITASCTGGLDFAKCLIQKLDVFKPKTLNAWYEYFSTGKTNYFYELMESLKD